MAHLEGDDCVQSPNCGRMADDEAAWAPFERLALMTVRLFYDLPEYYVMKALLAMEDASPDGSRLAWSVNSVATRRATGTLSVTSEPSSISSSGTSPVGEMLRKSSGFFFRSMSACSKGVRVSSKAIHGRCANGQTPLFQSLSALPSEALESASRSSSRIIEGF